MGTRTLETDYLVIGCGAAGLAFADALIDASDADVILVDRRHAPGGHWLEAYPFVRLHQPSSFYGVGSLPLGNDTIAVEGPEPGLYERATATEICAYFERVLERLLASGRVRFFPMCDYQGNDRFVSRTSGETYEVKVNKRRVDGTYLQTKVPASSPPPFEVAPGVRCVAVGDLVHVTEPPDRYVIVGGGKTSMDACLWLLETGVEPDRIVWVKPRELWLGNRAWLQARDLVDVMFEGASLQMEAAANATSVDDLFDRLSASGQLLRVDESTRPTMYRGATTSTQEVTQLRRITNVVREGHVRRVERHRIVLERGEVETTPGDLHVHCAAPGIRRAPAIPIFGEHVLTLQPVRVGSTSFNAAMAGFLEASHRDLAEKNRLCPPNPLPDTALDWLRGMIVMTNATHTWSREPDLAEWLEGSRLNISRGLKTRMHEPRAREAMQRFSANVRPGLGNLQRLLDELDENPKSRTP